jgi:hypothetical protein
MDAAIRKKVQAPRFSTTSQDPEVVLDPALGVELAAAGALAAGAAGLASAAGAAPPSAGLAFVSVVEASAAAASPFFAPPLPA